MSTSMVQGMDMVARARLAVSAVFMANGTAVGLWAAHIPIVGATHGIDETVLGMLLLTLAAGAMVAMPLSGWACGRFGADRTTRFFVAAFIAVMALPLLAPNLPLLFLSGLLFGIFNGGLDVAMNAQATDVEQARQRPTMSSFHGFWSLGGLIGAASGGMMIGAGWGDGSGIVAAAILFALIVACVWGWIRPMTQGEREAAGPSLVLPRGPALALGGLAMMVMVVEGASADWSALHLVQNTGATPAMAAAGFAAFSLAMASCRFIGDAITERFGRIMVLRLGGLLIAAGFLLTVLVPVPLVAAVGFGLIGLGAANIVPVLLGAASRLQGMAPGAGVAAVATIGYLGFLAGPPLIGFLAGTIGLAEALAVLTLAGVVLLLTAGMVDARD